MISPWILIRRLEEEKTYYQRRDLDSDFVRGLRSGITVSIGITRELYAEVRKHLKGNKSYRGSLVRAIDKIFKERTMAKNTQTPKPGPMK